MESSDILLVFVQVAIAIAGFSGIIATFQIRDGVVPKPTVVAGLNYIVNASFGAAYLSVLPIVLYSFGLQESTIWSVCSWHFAILPLLFIYLFNRDTKGIKRTKSHSVLHFSVQGICALVSLCNFLNAADILFHREPGPVLVGIVVGLATAANLFSRLLLAPMKKTIRKENLTK